MEGSSTPSSTASRIVDGDQSDLPVSPDVLECFICMEPPTDPVATSCGHVFCWPCMYRWLEDRPKPCPVCRFTLRRDVTLIPLYGAGSGGGAGPNNGSDSAGESIPASHDVIPPRPGNPLLFTSTANMDDSGHEHRSSSGWVYTPLSAINAYERSMRELSDALVDESDRVRSLSRDRGDLELLVNRLEQRNAALTREMEDRDWQSTLERIRRTQVEGRLERRNLLLVRMTRESLERERQSLEREGQHIETGEQLGEHIALLQKRLERANRLLQPGWSDEL